MKKQRDTKLLFRLYVSISFLIKLFRYYTLNIGPIKLKKYKIF